MEMIKTFIEIGTSDFDTCLDLVNNGDWTGIMVEPSPPYFKSLQEKVQQSLYPDNVWLENVAITDYNGMTAFTVSKQDGPKWVRGISSITAPHHKGSRLFDRPENQKWVEEHTEVPCMTLNSLIAKYNFEHINYLKIDTEGHELNIIESYDWEIKPDFLKIEHDHIDDIYLAYLLKEQGYTVYTEKSDIYAIR
tara:strand:- start:192 stop:770 length:579 start_codon:yes stop_codon:yes gene_type:complete